LGGQKDTFAPPTKLLGGAWPGCPPKSTPMNNHVPKFQGCRQKILEVWISGFILIFGCIFMHFQAFTTRTDSFGGLNPENHPLRMPMLNSQIKLEEWKSHKEVLRCGHEVLPTKFRIKLVKYNADIELISNRRANSQFCCRPFEKLISSMNYQYHLLHQIYKIKNLIAIYILWCTMAHCWIYSPLRPSLPLPLRLSLSLSPITCP